MPGKAKLKPKAERTAAEKETMREEKHARQQKFLKAGEAQRAKVKKMSVAQRQAYFAACAEKGKDRRKRLQGDLIFPVRRLRQHLRKRITLGTRKTTKVGKVGTESAIFTTAVVEYLVAEVLELAGECAVQMKKKRIVPRHLMAAIKMDDELATFLPKGATFSQAGVMPKAIPAFLAKNNVPRKDWNKNWANEMCLQHIHKGNRVNDSGSDINANKKPQKM